MSQTGFAVKMFFDSASRKICKLLNLHMFSRYRHLQNLGLFFAGDMCYLLGIQCVMTVTAMHRQQARIHVDDLELMMSVGIYHHEKLARQRVLISMTAEVALEDKIVDAEHTDQIVSYEDFVLMAQKTCESRHFNLLENLGETLARDFMRHPRVRSMQIRLTKPDVFPGRTAVGVSLSYVREDLAKAAGAAA